MEDGHIRIMWAAVITGITGLYGFFIKHLVGHASAKEIDKLRDAVQYRDNCVEKHKGIEVRLRSIDTKLERLLEYHLKK